MNEYFFSISMLCFKKFIEIKIRFFSFSASLFRYQKWNWIALELFKLFLKTNNVKFGEI